MRLLYLPIGIVFLCLSAYVMMGAVELQFYTPLGPGPGFFPFWLAAILGVLTILWLASVCLASGERVAEDLLPSRTGGVRILAVLAALIAYVPLLGLLGFRVTMLAFLFFVFFVPGRLSLLMSALFAVLGSFGAYYLFHDLLGVHLPYASFGPVKALGL